MAKNARVSISVFCPLLNPVVVVLDLDLARALNLFFQNGFDVVNVLRMTIFSLETIFKSDIHV